MLREIRSLRKVNHRNIVFLLSVLYDGHGVGLVLNQAYCDLKSAIRARRPGTIDVKICKLYLGQILESRRPSIQLVHLDLKPNNCLLDADHRLRIADFGLAQSIGTVQGQRTVVTMTYRAPEVFLRTPTFGSAIDMFAFGVIVAEMMGPLPWAHSINTPQQCFEHMLNYLGCPSGPLWPGADSLPGLWHGADMAGDQAMVLKQKGQIRFKARFLFDAQAAAMSDVGQKLWKSFIKNPTEGAHTQLLASAKAATQQKSGTQAPINKNSTSKAPSTSTSRQPPIDQGRKRGSPDAAEDSGQAAERSKRLRRAPSRLSDYEFS
ncbi:Cyclin-dependent kinase 2 [Tilletia horrida]|nr:Cyclin-dependent kinase 2 [Tilletia horrida]